MAYTYAAEYTEAEQLKLLNEFKRLDGKYYLDHAGSTLYSESQIKAVQENFISHLYCNPHSSRTTEDLIYQVRHKILKHFNTDHNHYSVIFTSGATASLKLVAETFEFEGNGSFLYLRDNHTSVLGMREIVQTNNIHFIEKKDLHPNLSNNTKGKIKSSLLVYPAQCNFNGTKYPLSLISGIQELGLKEHEEDIYICLDAASFAATNFLDLGKHRPDYVCLSFYKFFGYPTGLGALLISKRGESGLVKKYYGGGTVKIAMSSKKFHIKRDLIHERFEDGTISFLSIISLLQGFETLNKLVPEQNRKSTMDRISLHVFNLGRYLYNILEPLKYSNGRNLIKFYHDSNFDDLQIQGGILNFNVMHDDGRFVGFAEVACMASLHNIILRTGCFCNPGACQRQLHLSDSDVKRNFEAGHICGDAHDLIDGEPTGSVRVSFGYMSTKEDVDALELMLVQCYLKNRGREPLNVEHKSSLTKIKLKTICIYPIKSCAAFKIKTEWPLTAKGLKYDREWMIVDDNGVAVTQKQETKLCLITPEIIGNSIVLSYPEVEPIKISIIQKEEHSTASRLCQSKVCRDNVKGVDCGNEVGHWISMALNISGLRLIRQDEEDQRMMIKNSNKLISLSNQAQFLLINETSVKWLADQIGEGLDASLDNFVDRFRGNLIVESDTALEEAKWTKIKVGNIQMNAEGLCTRCQMICIDQSTGVKTLEPLRTIARVFKGKMRFGVYFSDSFATIGNVKVIKCNDFIETI